LTHLQVTSPAPSALICLLF